MPTERENIERNGPDPSRYPIEVFYSEEDGGFIAIAKDFPAAQRLERHRQKRLRRFSTPSMRGSRLQRQSATQFRSRRAIPMRRAFPAVKYF